MYDDFEEHSQIEIATATQWSNGEGFDIYIQRKNTGNINVSLTWDDIALFRKMFSDMDF